MSFLTDKQRRQLELCGIEPEKRQLPTPMWMQFFSVGLFRAALLLILTVVAVNVADWTVHREQQLQQQQKTMLRGAK